MVGDEGTNPLDRRLFLGGSAVTRSAHRPARWPAAASAEGGRSRDREARPLIADFITGFELEKVPPVAIERARTAFVDTVGVMLAGSRSEPSEIVREMVQVEGAEPAASVVGHSLRTSPQLAALATALPRTRSTSTSPTRKASWSHRSFRRCCRSPRAAGRRRPRRSRPSSPVSRSARGSAAPTRPQRRRPLARHRHHRDDRGGGRLRALAQGQGRGDPGRARHRRVDGGRRHANYGTMTKPLHAGQAARNAIVAALLGGRGFTATAAAIEGRGGFATFARGLEWKPEAFLDLGRQSDLAERGFKPEALSERRRDPHRHRRRAQFSRDLGRPRGGHHRNQGRHHEICRQPRQ